VARLAFLGVILGGLGKVENPLAAGLVVGLIQTVCTALLPFDYVYLVLYLLLAAIFRAASWDGWRDGGDGRNLAELQGIISLPKMPISVMPNRTLTFPSHIRSSFSRFAQHLSADQQPFAPTIWPDCRLRLRCGRGGYSAEIAKINVLGIPAP
jgi:hypothetical protein